MIIQRSRSSKKIALACNSAPNLLYVSQTFANTVNGLPGKGGAFNGGGPAIANGMVIATSGYAFAGGQGGNVLLAFSVGGE